MVTTREIAYGSPRTVGHLARPDGPGPWPAVLFAHDGIGLDGYQRGRVDHLAELGHVAFALDYHGGRVFTDPQEMLARVLPLVADPERMRTVGRAGLDVLLAEPGVDPDRVAAVGFGAGGTVALELGRAGVALRAVAALNPAPPPSRPAESAAIRGPVLIGVGSEDPIVTPEQLAAFTRELQAAGVDWRLTVYGGAEHAFHHPPAVGFPGASHHPVQGPRSWRDVLDLLAETLGTHDGPRTGGAGAVGGAQITS